MAIDSIGTLGSTQFQPRALQNPAQQQSGGPSVQQLLQEGTQQPQGSQPASAPVQTQTANAVQQPSNTQPSQQAVPPAANDGGSTVQTITDLLNQQTRFAVEPQQDTDQPETAPSSALNYGANGAANQSQSPNQPGRFVSLSI